MAASTIPSRNDHFLSSLSEFQEANRNPIIDSMKARLLSIEGAVVSLAEFVPEFDNYAASAKARCRRNSLLIINESSAIYLYTMMKPFYSKLNESLRAQNTSALKPWFPFLRFFLTALNKLPSCSTVVWRGVGDTVGDEFVEGIVDTWSGVNSCSSRVNVAGCFSGQMGTPLCIHATRGKDITVYSANQNGKKLFCCQKLACVSNQHFLIPPVDQLSIWKNGENT